MRVAKAAALRGDVDERDRRALGPGVHVHDLANAEWARRGDAGRRRERRSGAVLPASGRPSRHWIAIARLATPSSPVTGGGARSLMALTKAIKLGAQRLGMTDRKMSHRIAAVGLEAVALGDLAGQKIADHVFALGGDVDGARLERRQPIGVDVGEHARGGAELEQRDVLAFGDRVGELRLHLDDLRAR